MSPPGRVDHPEVDRGRFTSAVMKRKAGEQPDLSADAQLRCVADPDVAVPPSASIFRGREDRRPQRPPVRLDYVHLPVQHDRPAGGVHPGRLYPGRPAGRPPDHRPPSGRRPVCAPPPHSNRPAPGSTGGRRCSRRKASEPCKAWLAPISSTSPFGACPKVRLVGILGCASLNFSGDEPKAQRRAKFAETSVQTSTRSEPCARITCCFWAPSPSLPARRSPSRPIPSLTYLGGTQRRLRHQQQRPGDGTSSIAAGAMRSCGTR